MVGKDDLFFGGDGSFSAAMLNLGGTYICIYIYTDMTKHSMRERVIYVVIYIYLHTHIIQKQTHTHTHLHSYTFTATKTLCNSYAWISNICQTTLQVGGTAGAEWAHLKLPAENWGISQAQLTELATYRWWKLICLEWFFQIWGVDLH